MTGPIDSLDAGPGGRAGTIKISDPFHAHQFLVGGRGFGKNAAAAHWRRQMAAVEAMYPSLIPTQVTGNLNVRWSCPKPTGDRGLAYLQMRIDEQAALMVTEPSNIIDLLVEAKVRAREGKWVI